MAINIDNSINNVDDYVNKMLDYKFKNAKFVGRYLIKRYNIGYYSFWIYEKDL